MAHRLARASARGHAAMLAFSALVAGSFSLGSLVANDLAPVALNIVRFVLAAAILGAALALGPGMRRRDFRAPWRFVALGAVFGTYFVLMFEGLKTATPVATSAVFTLTPVMAAGFGWLLLRQVTTPRMAGALAVGAAGALWVIFRADLSALLALELGRGEAIYLVGCLAHAAYPALTARLSRGEPALAFAFAVLTATVAVMLVYGWPALLTTDWGALPARSWAIIVYLAVFSSTATFVLLQYASVRLPAAKVMAYTYLTPSWVIVWEIALGHGAPPPLVLVGVGLSVLALARLLKDEAPHGVHDPGV